MNTLTARSPERPPHPLAFLVELPRAAWNVVSWALSGSQLRGAPHGDGRPVLLLPGLVNSDRSNFAMRGFLRRLGYRAYGWELGRNFGVRAIGNEGERLIARIEAIHAETGEKVTLIGVSLGGIMARVIAGRRPDLVREVITVSSPFAGPPTATNVWRSFEWLTGQRIGDPEVKAFQEEAAAALPVPSTALWSRSDGLVNGLICHNENCRAIEISSSHMGVQLKPETLLAVAQVLAGR
jgi:pimeloyl-ACP methyl ester carboxylesterase